MPIFIITLIIAIIISIIICGKSDVGSYIAPILAFWFISLIIGLGIGSILQIPPGLQVECAKVEYQYLSMGSDKKILYETETGERKLSDLYTLNFKDVSQPKVEKVTTITKSKIVQWLYPDKFLTEDHLIVTLPLPDSAGD